MGIPQILMIVMVTLNIVVSIASHNELSVRRNNAVYDILTCAILVLILYAGGFWSQ